LQHKDMPWHDDKAHNEVYISDNTYVLYHFHRKANYLTVIFRISYRPITQHNIVVGIPTMYLGDPVFKFLLGQTLTTLAFCSSLQCLQEGTKYLILYKCFHPSSVKNPYKHPQSTNLPQCKRPSFTPIKNIRQNYSSVYLNLYTFR